MVLFYYCSCCFCSFVVVVVDDDTDTAASPVLYLRLVPQGCLLYVQENTTLDPRSNCVRLCYGNPCRHSDYLCPHQAKDRYG